MVKKMRKMNNKGFAISTVIYGLSIMGILIISILMGIMSTTRSNNRKLSQEIEDELVSYGKTSMTFDSNQNYTASEDGYYRIELWGKGASNKVRGAYTSGIIKLTKNTTINFTMESSHTKVSIGGNVIMQAADSASGANAGPGGTLNKYTNKMISTGGKIEFQKNDAELITGIKLKSNTLIGLPTDYKDGNNSNAGEKSKIAGYAGSIENQPYYFYDGIMLPGVNFGERKAKIEKLGTTLPIKNSNMQNVSAILDCVSKNDTDEPKTSDWKIKAMKDGKNIASSTLENKNNSSEYCRQVSITGGDKIDEIATFHGFGIDYKNHTIKVKIGSDWKTLKDTGGTKLSKTETATGYRISAYQPAYTLPPENGNYYIIPVLSENKVLTATTSKKEIAANYNIENLVKLDYPDSSKNQIWSIEQVSYKGLSRYKITEVSSFNALTINGDVNNINNYITTERKYNEIAPDESQLWDIIPVKNGTFQIKSILPSNDSTRPSGNICPNTDSDNSVIIAPNNLDLARFKLIKLDF